MKPNDVILQTVTKVAVVIIFTFSIYFIYVVTIIQVVVLSVD